MTLSCCILIYSFQFLRCIYTQLFNSISERINTWLIENAHNECNQIIKNLGSLNSKQIYWNVWLSSETYTKWIIYASVWWCKGLWHRHIESMWWIYFTLGLIRKQWFALPSPAELCPSHNPWSTIIDFGLKTRKEKCSENFWKVRKTTGDQKLMNVPTSQMSSMKIWGI